jgi:PhnB protein
MQVQPYLFFEGRCDEALEFYKKAVDAKLDMLMRFKDSPDPAQCSPATLDKVMHATFRIGGSSLHASDGRCDQPLQFKGFALSLTPATEAEAEKYFNALKDGGTVVMPLTKTFFSKRFGMLKDKFGVEWMVYVMP